MDVATTRVHAGSRSERRRRGTEDSRSVRRPFEVFRVVVNRFFIYVTVFSHFYTLGTRRDDTSNSILCVHSW